LADAKQGETYFDLDTRVWDEEGKDNANSSERSFNAFILDPIFKIYDAVKSNTQEFQDILTTLGVTLDDTEQQLSGERLPKAAMHKLFPAADTILEMICTFLPSPVAAQEYRAEWLYQGLLDDEAGASMHTCDENGALMLYVTRPIPTADDRGAYFLGRVFSGTVTAGQDVRTLQGHGDSRRAGRIATTSIIAGFTALTVDSVPAGNVVAIRGEFLERSSSQDESDPFTITTSEVAARCRDMTFKDMAALYVIVSVESEADTPSLVLGIRSLSKSNPYIDAFVNDLGQYFMQGFDEVQVQEAVGELQSLLGGRRIRISEPFFRYREGIKSPSEQTCMTKSPNKKIRLYVRASPLPEQLSAEISSGQIPTTHHSDRRSRYLVTHHAWPASAAQKIWSFAPLGTGPNILVNSTVAVKYVCEVRDSFTSGFQWSVLEGPLCEEPLRGVRIDVMDLVMMTDAIHRGGGQVIPTMRRAVYGSVLRARPVLFEGVYAVEVHVSGDSVAVVRGILGDRKGVVLKEGLDPVGLHLIQAHVRSGQVVGLQQAVISAVGECTYVCIWFDNWEEYEGDQEALVRSIRKRKGLPDTIPSWETVSAEFLSPGSILTFDSSMTQSNQYVRPHARKMLPVYSSPCPVREST
jgi:elongation factor 2